MNILALLCAGLVIASFQPRNEAGKAVDAAAQPDLSRTVITTPYYTLTAPAGLKEDAAMMAKTLDEAIGRLVKDYAAADAEKLLKGAKVAVRLADKPDEFCGPGQATNQSNWKDGHVEATIHLLAPSAHPDPNRSNAVRTSMNEPQDVAYCQRVLVHEYSTVLLESITRSKGKGWSFWNAPNWFIRGSEEYLGSMYSTEHARKITMGAYAVETQRQSLVTNDFGLEVKQEYVAGPMLIWFIHDHFGRETFIQIMKSEEPTFGKAMKKCLKVTPDEFFGEWTKWIEARARK